MANNYTNAEMTGMHFMYGLADGNTREAQCLYQKRFPATGSWKGVSSVGYISIADSGAFVLNQMG
jgi:hypothetical protein